MEAQKMNSQDKDKKEKLRIAALWMLFIIGTAAYMGIVWIVTTNIEKGNIKNDVSDSISIMKDVCQKYDDYNLSISTKNMQSIINKINILSRYTKDIDLNNADQLREYADLQYLTGIFVLDGEMNMVSSVDTEGIGRSYFLQKILAGGAPQSVYEHPEKVYAGDMTVDLLQYDYAVKARTDAPGVIICYKDMTEADDDKYEFSLNTLLPADIFGEGAVFVITDGSNVICSNDKSLENIRTADAPVRNVRENDAMKDDSRLIKLETAEGSWYGMHDTARDYMVYIFYPDSVVFADRLPVMAVAFGLYALLCALVSMTFQRARKKRLLQIEKEYHLVNAIASIYSTNIIIRLKENKFSVVLQTERMARALEGVASADKALETLIDSFVAHGYRYEFSQFTDMNTVAERIKGKPFMGYTFEDNEGKWHQALLIPQNRDPDDEVTSVMLVTRDVSEQKRREMEYQERLRQTAERANRANDAKTDFLRRMNHDIRTPINGIVGMIEINSKTDDQNVIKENREKAKKAANHLLSLVNDVLEMSKLEDGIIPVEHDSFNIQKLTGDVLVVAGMRAAEHKLVLEHEEAPEAFAYPYVYGSPMRLRQILLNIVSNAIKYNKQGGSIKFSVEAKSVDKSFDKSLGKSADKDKNTVSYRYVIADTGIGMSEEFLKHIFEPFSQETSGARTVYRGTGLGMAIVKTLLDQMDGTIDITSEAGAGTTVAVTIPFEISENSENAESGRSSADYTVGMSGMDGMDGIQDPATDADINAHDSTPDIAGMHIIIAEDNELNMEIAKYILEDAGASVHSSYDGAQAVEAFSSAPPGTYDAILMDIMMPVMDGYEATRSIRGMGEVRPDAAEIPVIAMTANAFADDRRKSMEAGMNEHITKPIDIEKMISVIAEYKRK